MFLILSTRSKSLELDAIEWGSGISSSFLRVGNKLPEGCHPDINRWLLLSEFMVMRALEQPPHTDTSHQQKLQQKARCRVWLVSHPGGRSWGHGPASSEMSNFHIETTLYFATASEMTSTESAHFVHLFTDFFPLWPGFEYDFSKRTETRGFSALDTETLLLIGIIKLYLLHKYGCCRHQSPSLVTRRHVASRDARRVTVPSLYVTRPRSQWNTILTQSQHSK